MIKVTEELIHLSGNFRTVGLIEEHDECVYICEAEQGEAYELNKAVFFECYEVVSGTKYTMKAEYAQAVEEAI